MKLAKHFRALRPRTITALLMLSIGFGAVSGCDPKPEGPKWKDDKAAHARVYHPDIQREYGASTQPSFATTQPEGSAELTFGSGAPVGTPVLFVNGEPISVSDILEPIIDELEKKSKTDSVKVYVQLVRDLINRQIEYQISTLAVYLEARKTYSEKRMQEGFAKAADEEIKKRINEEFGGIYARYEAHLKAVELKPEDMKEKKKRELMVKEFIRERFKPMLREPPRREVFNYYEEHKADYSTPEKAELFLIEIPFAAELERPADHATEKEWAAARDLARRDIQRAKEELASGVEFEAVARKYSKGPTASQGGAWGEVSPGSLTKRWVKPAEVLFTLQPGQVSDIVDTPEALFIVKCGQRTAAHQASFEEAQKQILDKLIDEQFNHYRAEYLQGILKQATVDHYEDFNLAVRAAVPRPAKFIDKGDAEFKPSGS